MCCSSKKGATVVKQKKRGLRVESSGKRHFISVPAGRALDLHNFLRGNRVHSAPPEPSFKDFDCIELPTSCNVEVVQALLDGWD